METMKKIYNKILLFALSATMMSCAGFLDEEPKSDLAPQLIYNSKTGITSVLRGCYRIFTENSFSTQGGIKAYGITPAAQRYIFLLTEVPGDDCWIRNTNNAPRVTLDTYQHDADNENIAAMYFSHYIGIKDCNNLLRGLKDSPVTDEEFKEKAKAEARAIRAYCYFNLVRLFGDNPVVTEDVDVNNAVLTRQPKRLIYKMIVDDLTFAAGVLPDRDAEGAGRMSAAAANAMLAEVYLTMAGRVYDEVKEEFEDMPKREMYKKAAQYAENVMGMSEYDLFPDYQQMFTVDGNNCTESILEAVSLQNQYPTEACPDVQNRYDFGIDPATGEQAYKGMFYSLIPNTTNKYRYLTKTLGRYTLAPEFKALFDQFPNDKRLGTTIKSFNNSFGNQNIEVYSCIKYADSTVFDRNVTDANQSRAHYKMIRYANVLLIYAEAMNEYNNGPDSKALEAIKAIRKRAGITDSSIPTGYEEFKVTVENERRKELFFEGYRWFDLVRTGKLAEKVQKCKSGVNYKFTPTVLEKHYLFPIPNTAFQNNPNLGNQNPDW